MARDPMPERRRINPALVCGLIGITVLVIGSRSMIGVLGLLFLAVKLVLSARRPTAPRLDCSIDSLHVVVLVPMYNEDPEIIRRSIRSLLNQTHVPDRIHVIDDGSNSPDALDAVKDEVRHERTRVRLSRHRFNLGKREHARHRRTDGTRRRHLRDRRLRHRSGPGRDRGTAPRLS